MDEINPNGLNDIFMQFENDDVLSTTNYDNLTKKSAHQNNPNDFDHITLFNPAMNKSEFNFLGS